jgi:hypothetical protein
VDASKSSIDVFFQVGDDDGDESGASLLDHRRINQFEHSCQGQLPSGVNVINFSFFVTGAGA